MIIGAISGNSFDFCDIILDLMRFNEGIDTVYIENISDETSTIKSFEQRNGDKSSKGIGDDEVKEYSQEGV